MEDASKSIAFEPAPTAGDAAPDHASTLSTTGPDQGGKGGEGGDAELADIATAEPAVTGTMEGGEAGKEVSATTPFTPSTSLQMSNSAFLAGLNLPVPDGAHLLVTSLKGNPESNGGWPPFDADEADKICTANQNNYFNCSSFRPDTDSKLAARKELAAAYHVVILDDIGTKADPALIAQVPPSWRIETSPGCFHVGFKLDPPLTDAREVEALQKKIAAAGLTDKGALGMARWGRLPNGVNGKPKYKKDGKPFATSLHEYNPDIAYSADALMGLLVPHTEEVEVKVRPATKAKRKPDRETDDDRVYFPRTDEHPVVTEFKQRGLYKREISPGKHDVTCPWCSEHTDAIDTGAAYFEPDAEHPSGGFCCQHSHKDQYHIRQLLDEFGLSVTQMRNRPLIRTAAGEMRAIVDAAEEILAQRGDLYQAGGLIVTAGRDDVTGDVNMKPLSESALTLALASDCDWEKYDKRSHGWERCDPPIRHVGMIYKAQGYGRLPTLNGLARQPYYREQDGQLVRTPGYDAVSKRLGIFNPEKFPPIQSTPEAARAALAELEELIGEFHFYQPTDKAAALAAIFTAVTRPSIGLAPAFHVSAPASGSGKSFLCETISLFASPGTPARMSYPKTSDEATKAILSSSLSRASSDNRSA